MSLDQDTDAKRRWELANGLRKKVSSNELSPRNGMLAYLQENLGRPVHGEELRYVAQIQDWPRRARELRTELGYPVSTRMQGRTDLPVGVYVLENNRQFPQHDRRISDATRVAVLVRDEFGCRVCGWKRGSTTPDDPRKNLELHHIKPHVQGGANEAGNLVTLCNVDHDNVHAERLHLADYGITAD